MMTTAMRDLWRSPAGRQGVALAQFTLTKNDGTTRTLNCSTVDTFTPDGVFWEPLIADQGPISDRGAFCSNEIGRAETTMVLNGAAAFQAVDEDIRDSLKSYYWKGALVTIWIWDSRATDFADVLPELYGIVTGAEVRLGKLTLAVKQRRDWDRPIQGGIVSRDLFPNATPEALGEPLPVMLGDLTAAPARPPWTVPQPIAGTINYVRRPSRVHQGVLTDAGYGFGNDAVKCRAYFARNQLSDFGSVANGTPLFFKLSDTLCLCVPSATGYDASRGSYADFVLDSVQTYAGCPVSHIGGRIPVGATAGSLLPPYNAQIRNASILVNPDHEYRYATADETHAGLKLLFSGLADLGYIGGIDAYVGLRTRQNGGGQFAWRLKASSPNNGTYYFDQLVPQSSNPGIWTPVIWSDVGGGTTPGWTLSDLTIYLSGPTAGVGYGTPLGEIDFFFIYVLIRFEPRRSFVERSRDGSLIQGRAMSRKVESVLTPIASRFAPGFVARQAIAARRLEGVAFCNAKGSLDDGSGTYTGTASALVSRLPDLAHYLLSVYGGEAAGNLELASSAFGSFIDARVNFRTWRYTDMVYGLSMSEGESVSEALSWLAACGPALIALGRTDDKWHIIPWADHLDPTYDLTFTPDHLVGNDPISAVFGVPSYLAASVRVDYAWDAGRRSFTEQTLVDATREDNENSRAGRDFFDIRDESSTVVASLNDKLDFIVSGGTQKNPTLTLGVLDMAARANDVKIQMEAVEARYFYPAYGFTVYKQAVGGASTGFKGNDWIRFWQQGGVLNVAILTVSSDVTPEERAADAQAALNLADPLGGWAVSYSQTTRKFTFSVPGGGAGLAWGATTAASNVRERSAAAVFGFDSVDLHSGTSWTSTFAVEPEQFRLVCSIATTLMFSSGTNGFTAAVNRSCAQVLGFEPSVDSPAATYHIAVAPKGNREDVLASVRDRYGIRRGVDVDGRAVYDSTTGRELRNRYIALTGTGRVELRVSFEYCPDMERGHVIQLSADFDAVIPYPDPTSDGSWAGKSLIVVEVEQLMGPLSFATNIVAVSLGSQGG